MYLAASVQNSFCWMWSDKVFTEVRAMADNWWMDSAGKTQNGLTKGDFQFSSLFFCNKTWQIAVSIFLICHAVWVLEENPFSQTSPDKSPSPQMMHFDGTICTVIVSYLLPFGLFWRLSSTSCHDLCQNVAFAAAPSPALGFYINTIINIMDSAPVSRTLLS